MTPTLHEAAHKVLLPAFSGIQLSDSVKRFLDSGGCSLLLGETREEYLARSMGDSRRASETREDIRQLTELARSYRRELIIAVDQEPGGICRLHDLVPSFPPAENFIETSTRDFQALAEQVAESARELGINCFLAPILDCVTGPNPWLHGRTWSREATEISRLSCAFIRGIQNYGVIACAKHFPGYGTIEGDPATDPHACNDLPSAVCNGNIGIFQEAISQDVAMVMTGPAIVRGIDPDQPASTSPLTIDLLKGKLGFTGVVLSDDLDSAATLGDRSLIDTAVDALKSGCDLLLVADTADTLAELVAGICAAVEEGRLSGERLLQAAEAVQSLAAKYS